jgi:HAD superfamily hydrolase (TIGR01509 family)
MRSARRFILKQPIEAVLFDLDGTLVHSEAVAARTVGFVFAKHGTTLDPSHALAVTGKTWAAAMDELEKLAGLPAPRDQLLQEILEEYRVRLKTEVHPVPGSETAVVSLAARYRLALVSGSYREEILFALQKLRIIHHFDPILGAEDYLNSKPAPDGYLKALGILGVDPSRAVVFEDSEPGIRSAIAAGCRVIAVRHCGSLDERSPWLLRAHAIVDTLEDVHPGWLESTLG